MNAHPPFSARDRRFAWLLLAPALVLIAAVALVPLLAAVWESLHHHDLRMPWLGRPFVGLDNYLRALTDQRLRAAFLHTLLFASLTVLMELIAGMALALALHTIVRGRALVRMIVVLPWALPTVVAALVWRFMFDHEGIASGVLPDVLTRPYAAWLPLILADVWKSTPFVALLVLAGLQGIDPGVLEAARMDGATAWGRFRYVTLPLLRPAIAVALVFRTLDAFRVFDLVYVLTSGGPGTATEVLSLYTFATLLQDLRFGYGAALSVITFLVTFGLALIYVRLLAVRGAEA